ncbi:MAG: FtsW/RodA/SpoVE family cell cycle protein [Clostridiales bacterium]|nr:FtsW/RodA/SpoVE family cell cycle protein [Clostridiales bacterium]
MKKIFRRLGYKMENYDFRLIFYVLILSVIGIFMVHSATVNEVEDGLLDTTQKQILGVGIGIVCMIAISLIDYKKVLKFAAVIFVVNVAVLIYVKFAGNNYLGAKRWISIPGFGTIQPSEFSKIAIILVGTAFLCKFREKINHVIPLFAYLMIAAIPCFLILMQPDLSTTIVILLTVIVMLYLSGISSKWVYGVSIVVAILAVILLFAVYQPGQTLLNYLIDCEVLKPHQLNRINAYFFPGQHKDLVYQQTNSIMAIGSGQFFGKGLNTTTYESVKNGNFLSEEQCDFIFAVVGEELGFVGSAAIIVLIGLIAYECIRISRASNYIGGLIAGCSIATLLAAQSFINIGVATLILPNTGIPLPFISAGLSSLVSSFIMIGFVLNIGLQRGKLELNRR